MKNVNIRSRCCQCCGSGDEEPIRPHVSEGIQNVTFNEYLSSLVVLTH